MEKPETIIVAGLEFEMEVRACANMHCNCNFKVSKNSLQSICSISCWEFENKRMWFKDRMPAIVYPGQPKTKYERRKKKGSENGAKMIEAYWREQQAKKAAKTRIKANGDPRNLMSRLQIAHSAALKQKGKPNSQQPSEEPYSHPLSSKARK